MTAILIGLLLVIAVPLAIVLIWGAAFAAMAIVVGVIMAIACVIIKLCIVPYFVNRQKMRLDQNHILLVPQRMKVRVDVNTVYNGFNPYVIDCYYTDENTGREFVFTSPPFTTDPTPYLNGATLGVFVNPVDYSNYYVDVSQLNIGEHR